MQLTRYQKSWNPWAEFEDLSDRFTRLFGLARTAGNNEKQALPPLSDWSPACDITETDSEYRVLAELPSVKKEDVKVTLENGVLAIRGERREQKEEKAQKFHRRELAYGSFTRSFTLPEDADAEKVKAAFENGLLTVTVGRSPTKAVKAKEIAIR
jgi:HSP20 family protein